MQNDSQQYLMSDYSAGQSTEASTAERYNESPERYSEEEATQKDKNVRKILFKLGITKIVTTFGDYDLIDKLKSADDIDTIYKDKS